jgi:[glutamine synthetase] adenylyltransferase / [glutamine synthetase]-adenylyl-L-tyrosine phosphorylase
LRGLRGKEENLPWLDWVRAYRRAQLLRIGLRDVLAFASIRENQSEYSALAEACLLFVQEQLGFTNELTIVAMGKFGGRELSYGADLDVIFIGENTKSAAEIIRAMTEPTAEGAVFGIDARLRPEGDAGPLECTLASYEAYFKKRAQVWEAQSLTKARPISGPLQQEYLTLAQRVWGEYGARSDLFAHVSAMHARVVKERAGADDFVDFKTGRGGLMHLEFFTQAHQMRFRVWQPSTLEALAALAERGMIDSNAASKLCQSYLLLRRFEAVLRRVDDKAVSTLPREESEQQRLAIRCGYPHRDLLLADYRQARDSIAELCQWPET